MDFNTSCPWKKLSPPPTTCTSYFHIFRLFSKDLAKVIVDETSLALLNGSHIDFSSELIGSSFKILENPQAASGCGCGTSFDLK